MITTIYIIYIHKKRNNIHFIYITSLMVYIVYYIKYLGVESVISGFNI